jgi:glycosyltransferase involved in cell wall biosynthesis
VKICKIYPGEYPWDVRVEKISRTLVEHGHDVKLLCRWSPNKPDSEEQAGLSIHRFPLRKGHAIPALLRDVPAFVNARWTEFIDRVVQQQKSDLILIRDLPLGLNAIQVAHHHGIPVVLDMAENYPALFMDVLRFERKKYLTFFLKNPYVAKLIERVVVRKVTRILAVVEESRERLVQLGVAAEKIVIVSNTPRLSPTVGDQPEFRKPGEVRLIYVGGFERARGLEWIIRVFRLCIATIPGLQFYILGDGPERPRLEDLSRRNGVKGRIHFLGWVEPDKVQFYINQSDIGLVPHIVTEHTNSTIPNKLFDYMYGGLPVLASSARPLERIIGEEQCGVNFEYGDARSLVEALRCLGDAKLRRKMADNGRAAVNQRYNWPCDASRLMSVLRTIGESVTVHAAASRSLT